MVSLLSKFVFLLTIAKLNFPCVSRLLTETVRQSQEAWGGLKDWTEVEVIYNQYIFVSIGFHVSPAFNFFPYMYYIIYY